MNKKLTIKNYLSNQLSEGKGYEEIIVQTKLSLNLINQKVKEIEALETELSQEPELLYLLSVIHKVKEKGEDLTDMTRKAIRRSYSSDIKSANDADFLKDIYIQF